MHEKGEVRIVKPVVKKQFVQEDIENTPSQAPRKKIALSASAIAAVNLVAFDL
jgi:hypothetical protein